MTTCDSGKRKATPMECKKPNMFDSGTDEDQTLNTDLLFSQTLSEVFLWREKVIASYLSLSAPGSIALPRIYSVSVKSKTEYYNA